MQSFPLSALARDRIPVGSTVVLKIMPIVIIIIYGISYPDHRDMHPLAREGKGELE